MPPAPACGEEEEEEEEEKKKKAHARVQLREVTLRWMDVYMYV